MRLNNTTDIPNQLIAIAVAHSLPEGVVVNEITVKNKRAGKTLGQWGWYYHVEKRIVLIVPQIVRYTFSNKMPYSGVRMRLNSRADFLIAVMAHELRHAWQFQIDKDACWHDKQASEIDAEAFELRQLTAWRELHQTEAAASVAR